MFDSDTAEDPTRSTRSSSSDPYHGLVWVDDVFGPEPQWTHEPEISAIERTIQSLHPSSTTQVQYLTQGAFNKIYQVQVDDVILIMRVSLPSTPFTKRTVKSPRILSYNATRETEIGFEWILMTQVPGKPLADVWRSLSINAKSDLVKKFAGFSITLWRNQLEGIGNIYPPSATAEEPNWAGESAANDSPDSPRAVPTTGQIVSLGFLWGSHTRHNVNRGPFLSSHDWMQARFTLARNSCQETLAKYAAGNEDPNSDPEYEMEFATRSLEIIEKLEEIYPRVFPPSEQVPEPSVVFHDDLSQHNILVSEEGELTGVLDWECVSALPLWKACYYPTFLHARPRQTEPNIEMYDGGNPHPGGAYWEHLHEYEATLLRGVFLDEMRKSEPGWVDVFDASHLKRDFDVAVQYFDTVLVRHKINQWVTDVAGGNENPQSLSARIGC